MDLCDQGRALLCSFIWILQGQLQGVPRFCDGGATTDPAKPTSHVAMFDVDFRTTGSQTRDGPWPGVDLARFKVSYRNSDSVAVKINSGKRTCETSWHSCEPKQTHKRFQAQAAEEAFTPGPGERAGQNVAVSSITKIQEPKLGPHTARRVSAFLGTWQLEHKPTTTGRESQT